MPEDRRLRRPSKTMARGLDGKGFSSAISTRSPIIGVYAVRPSRPAIGLASRRGGRLGGARRGAAEVVPGPGRLSPHARVNVGWSFPDPGYLFPFPMAESDPRNAVLLDVQLPGGHRGRHDAVFDRAGAARDTLGPDLPVPREPSGATRSIPARRRQRQARGAEDPGWPAAAFDLLVVDHELSPSQARNLAKATGAEVLDRTAVIRRLRRHAARGRPRRRSNRGRLSTWTPRCASRARQGDRQRGGIAPRAPASRRWSSTPQDPRPIAELQESSSISTSMRRTQCAARATRAASRLVRHRCAALDVDIARAPPGARRCGRGLLRRSEAPSSTRRRLGRRSARWRSPLPCPLAQPRRQVLETHDLDCPWPPGERGMAAKDLQDDGGPIEDLGTRRLLEVSRLRWRELLIDDQQIDLPPATRISAPRACRCRRRCRDRARPRRWVTEGTGSVRRAWSRAAPARSRPRHVGLGDAG